ncbi:MAG: hypothetical protein Ct9H300mP8_12000 [Gammaproteobacteria bacterium]|nr:MAG: hypothetical protein Ct9H300mP8_12000 [Gammaproteobacteria bacterium]
MQGFAAVAQKEGIHTSACERTSCELRGACGWVSDGAPAGMSNRFGPRRYPRVCWIGERKAELLADDFDRWSFSGVPKRHGRLSRGTSGRTAAPYCKYAHAIEHVHRIPYYVNQAVRHSLFGRPGPVYLDFPDDIINGQCEEEDVAQAATVPEPPRTLLIRKRSKRP